MKKISVIIPCYNVERYIDRCVQSILSQTIGIDNLELIFVDDASSDSTFEKLRNIEKEYPNDIIVIHCDENGRQGTARNIGLQYATGEYIAFVDSDDYISQEMYQEMYQISIQEKCDMVRCRLIREKQDGTVINDLSENIHFYEKIQIKTEEDRKQLILRGFSGGVVCGLYKRSFIMEKQLFFPENITYEDNYWMAMLIRELNSYYIIDKNYYHYVVNYESTIMKKNSLHHLDRLVIELMKVEEYKKKKDFEVYHDEIEFNFLKLYFINTIRILFVRFDHIPYDIIYDMKEDVKRIFPNYLSNPYLHELPQLQFELLKIIELDLNDEKLSILAKGYREVLRKM